MIVSIIYLIISFLLENIMANIFTSTLGNPSYFTTMYTIIALVVIYPYFSNDKKYLILVVVFGALFDILYSSTILINLVIFFMVAVVIKILNNIISDNIIMINIISIISVTVYHLLTFIILNIATSSVYSISLFLGIITHSVLMTIVYTSISYLIIKLIYNKIDVKQIK